jgi:hypothetical protein
MDEDLANLDRELLIAEVKKLKLATSSRTTEGAQ